MYATSQECIWKMSSVEKFDVFTAVKIQVEFCVVMLCRGAAG
jgi:hypothetical protein